MSDTSQRLTRDILEWQSRGGLVEELVMFIETEIQAAVEARMKQYSLILANGWSAERLHGIIREDLAKLHNKETDQ